MAFASNRGDPRGMFKQKQSGPQRKLGNSTEKTAPVKRKHQEAEADDDSVSAHRQSSSASHSKSRPEKQHLKLRGDKGAHKKHPNVSEKEEADDISDAAESEDGELTESNDVPDAGPS